MPEYRRLRADYSILEICKTPKLAAEVTLQPVEALGVDAAIIFADLLLPLEPMGLKLEFVAGDGPVVRNPVRNAGDVDALHTRDVDQLNYVGEAIREAKALLDGQVPLIGFVGAPFTLASYMIEGGGSRHYVRAKTLMYSDPKTWQRLMEKIVEVLVPYAASQVSHGAALIQVFDSWVGALSPGDYERCVLPYTRMLVRAVQSTGVPAVYFSTGGSSYVELLHEAGGEVLGLDWRIRLDDAWRRIRYEAAVQGNLDPVALFAPLPELRARVEDVLSRAGDRPGFIFNLGHGILPETPVENVKAAVGMVREFSRKRSPVKEFRNGSLQ